MECVYEDVHGNSLKVFVTVLPHVLRILKSLATWCGGQPNI